VRVSNAGGSVTSRAARLGVGAAPVHNGYHRIAINNGRFLRPMNTGTNPSIGLNSAFGFDANSQWYFRYHGGFYTIRPHRYSNRFLTRLNINTGQNNITLTNPTSGAVPINAQWIITRNANGQFNISPINAPHLVLSSPNSNTNTQPQLRLSTDTTASSRTWFLQRVQHLQHWDGFQPFDGGVIPANPEYAGFWGIDRIYLSQRTYGTTSVGGFVNAVNQSVDYLRSRTGLDIRQTNNRENSHIHLYGGTRAEMYAHSGANDENSIVPTGWIGLAIAPIETATRITGNGTHGRVYNHHNRHVTVYEYTETCVVRTFVIISSNNNVTRTVTLHELVHALGHWHHSPGQFELMYPLLSYRNIGVFELTHWELMHFMEIYHLFR